MSRHSGIIMQRWSREWFNMVMRLLEYCAKRTMNVGTWSPATIALVRDSVMRRASIEHGDVFVTLTLDDVECINFLLGVAYAGGFAPEYDFRAADGTKWTDALMQKNRVEHE